MSPDSVHMGHRIRSESHAVQPTQTPIGQGIRVRANYPKAWAASTSSWTRDSVYDVFVAQKSGCTQMLNSNDVASNEMLWERVLSLLVVGASVLGGSAVVLIQVLPPILHGFP